MVALERRLRRQRLLAEEVNGMPDADPRQVARIYQDTRQRITAPFNDPRRCRVDHLYIFGPADEDVVE
jgi:hypothetical protein